MATLIILLINLDFQPDIRETGNKRETKDCDLG